MLSRTARSTIVIALIFLLMPLHLVHAAGDGTPKKIGSFSGWEAYQTKQGSHPTCYMILRPASTDMKMPPAAKVPDKLKAKSIVATKDKKKSEQSLASTKRSDVYVMVTFRPEESMNPVISYRSGYNFKQNSEVLFAADDKSYNLFTDKGQAWARSGAMDIALTNALRRAKRLTIQGSSNEGAKSNDIFNPDGAEKAYKAVVKACGIT